MARKQQPFKFREDYAVRVSHKMWLALHGRDAAGYWTLALVRQPPGEEPEIIAKSFTDIEEQPDLGVVRRFCNHMKSNRSSLGDAIKDNWGELYRLTIQMRQKFNYIDKYETCVGHNEKRIEKVAQSLKEAGLAIPKVLLHLVDAEDWARDLTTEEQEQLKLVEDLVK